MEMLRVLNMSEVCLDEGEGAYSGKLPKPVGSQETLVMPPPLGSDSLTWFPEGEPPLVNTDTWARTVVESRPRVKKPRLNDLATEPPESETARSGASRATSRGAKSRGGSRPGSSAKYEEAVVVVEVSEPGDKKDVGLTKAEQEYLLQMKLDAQRKKLADEQAARDAIKAQKEKELWDKRIAELKGKDHTFDVNGEIIVIDPIKPEKLPDAQMAMNIKINDVDADGGRRGRGRGASAAGKGKSRSKSPTKKGQPKDYFTVSATLQPSIFEVANIGSGVSINAGGTNRSGSMIEDMPGKMSRASYQHLRGGAAGVDDTTTMGMESQNDMSNLTFDDTFTLGDEASETAAVGGVPESEPLSPAADEVSIQGGRKRANVPEQGGEEEREDDILKLVQAPDWGQVGGATKDPVVPRLPIKPGSKVKAATASPRPKFPRDRLPVEATKFTADMTKLSAPGLGESTGHGMPINGRRGDMGSQSPRSKGEPGLFPAIDSARDSFVGGGGSVSSQSPEAKRMLGLR